MNVIVALVFLGYATMGPVDRRTIAFTQTFINFAFAIANALLGFGLVIGSRRG
ncbi:MAG: hypothetical protein ACYDAL_00120 [Candidatus Dormibacteraceae bacterium]